MSELELHFLGDLEVIRDGEVLPLPPSKKTRALLAYLALNQRSFRRERLCELLWEIPDDPRGSLRWSLSKLRRIVDDAQIQRIVADRVSVAFDTDGVEIDVSALKELAENGLASAPIEELTAAAARYQGNFLEGLELSNFHEFHAWCIAERELALRAQSRLLETLVDRLSDQPERALTHARAWVGIAPYDETARARLIRLLVESGHNDEAEEHYKLGARMLAEIGAAPTGTLSRALRKDPDKAERKPARPARQSAEPPRGAGSLIGRDSEVERLERGLQQAIDARRGGVVLLRGEPGIGKTTLLAVANRLARAADALLLEANAYESEAIRPFALWLDALRRLPEGDASLVFDDSHGNRDRLFDRLSDMIGNASSIRPVVVIFDDVQWADESSAAALHFVVRNNRDRPFLAVLAARETELRDNGPVQRALRELRHAGLLEELRLAPLNAAEVQAIIAEHAPQADQLRLSQQCSGNPLLAIELARAESDGNSGNSLDELIRERLSRFDLEGAEVLQWAALLAPRFDISRLERLTQVDSNRIGEVLAEAEQQSMLVRSNGGLAFSHDLVARCLYRDIPAARRRTMHRRVAELLVQDAAMDLERAADLAHHASHSGDTELAARAMVAAGRLCVRFFANDEAATLAQKGLQLTEQLPGAVRVCLTLELYELLLSAARLDDWEAAATRYAALAEQALDHGELSHARLGYFMASYVRWMHGQWSGAHREIMQSELVSRTGSEEEHIVGMAEAAKCLVMLERDLTTADAMLMEAQALARRKGLNLQAIPAALGMLRYHENRLDEAVELFEQARTVAKSAGDRVNEFQANEYLTMIDFDRGSFESARARCAALLEIGAKLREGSEAPFARALNALCTYAIDDENGDLEAQLEALRIVDAKYRLAYALTRSALIDIDRGRTAIAIARSAEALGYAETLERATEMMLAHVALARAYRESGNTKAAEQHLAALPEFDEAPVAQWARMRAKELVPASGAAS